MGPLQVSFSLSELSLPEMLIVGVMVFLSSDPSYVAAVYTNGNSAILFELLQTFAAYAWQHICHLVLACGPYQDVASSYISICDKVFNTTCTTVPQPSHPYHGVQSFGVFAESPDLSAFFTWWGWVFFQVCLACQRTWFILNLVGVKTWSFQFGRWWSHFLFNMHVVSRIFLCSFTCLPWFHR